MIEHRHIVVEQRIAGAEKGRGGNQQAANCGTGEGDACGLQGDLARQAPNHPGDGEKPDQYRLIHVDDQGDAEEILGREQGLRTRYPRDHHQNSEDPGQGQSNGSEHHPGGSQPLLIGGRVQMPVGIRHHFSLRHLIHLAGCMFAPPSTSFLRGACPCRKITTGTTRSAASSFSGPPCTLR